MSDFGILRGTTATGVDMNGRRKKGTRRAKNPRDINNIAGELAKEKQIESCCEENEFTEEDLEQKTAPCWEGYEQIGMKKGKNGKMVPNCVPIKGKSAKPLRDPKGGLTAAGRAHFKRTEGANLKPGVKGAADTPEKMRRKGSFLTRFFTNPSGPMKDDNGKPTRLALSAAAWGEPVPQDASDAAALAAKGRRMLERYENSKEKTDSRFELEQKTLGPTIGGGNQQDATRDHDGDGVVNDGTQDEKPAPRKNVPQQRNPRNSRTRPSDDWNRAEDLRNARKSPYKPGYILSEGDEGDFNVYDGEPPKGKPYFREHRDGSLYEFRPNQPPRKFGVGKNEVI